MSLLLSVTSLVQNKRRGQQQTDEGHTHPDCLVSNQLVLET